MASLPGNGFALCDPPFTDISVDYFGAISVKRGRVTEAFLSLQRQKLFLDSTSVEKLVSQVVTRVIATRVSPNDKGRQWRESLGTRLVQIQIQSCHSSMKLGYMRMKKTEKTLQLLNNVCGYPNMSRQVEERGKTSLPCPSCGQQLEIVVIRYV